MDSVVANKSWENTSNVSHRGKKRGCQIVLELTNHVKTQKMLAAEVRKEAVR